MRSLKLLRVGQLTHLPEQNEDYEYEYTVRMFHLILPKYDKCEICAKIGLATCLYSFILASIKNKRGHNITTLDYKPLAVAVSLPLRPGQLP